MRTFLLLWGGLLAAVPGAWAQSSGQPRVQDHNRHIWLAWFSDARLTRRWGLHTEVQVRRAAYLRDPQQYFYRVGANYHATDRLTITPGYVYLRSLPYGNYPEAGRSQEQRLYLRADLEDELGRLQLTHRYLQDMRWLRGPGETSYARQYRSRYRVQLQFPLTGPAMEAGTLYALASDEIFISYGANASRLFNQNRLYGGLGYQVTEALSLETSYLHQTVQHDDGVVFEQNHTLQVSLNFNPDFRKQEP